MAGKHSTIYDAMNNGGSHIKSFKARLVDGEWTPEEMKDPQKILDQIDPKGVLTESEQLDFRNTIKDFSEGKTIMIKEDTNSFEYSKHKVTQGANKEVTPGTPEIKGTSKAEAKHEASVNDGGSSAATDTVTDTAASNAVTDATADTAAGAATNADGISTPEGLGWFAAHFKEIAIVAAGSAILIGLVKLIKGAVDKSIKYRYNKVVKTLQKVQEQFTLDKNGLDMGKVMPGIGSKIADWASRIFSGNWKSKKTKGNIGLHPFCTQYVDEIQMDYKTATDAFSKIKLGSEDADNQENVSSSAESGKVYKSFYEAYSEDFINEGMSEDKVNESVLAMISTGMVLASLTAKAGKFLYQRYKDGKPVGEPKAIQVTEESTREICYAIINNYADKYVNMEQVFSKLGIDTKSLADLDKSSCDKLRDILEKYQKPEKNAYTKQYARVNAAYKKMLKHYYNIGDGIISNFVKYSEQKDETDANLIIASKEKLQNMWDSQKDFYDSNFSRVMIDIVGSEPYQAYLQFIIEKVIPVFKSGLASDADYILDVHPKKDEHYILRQTSGQTNIENGEDIKGKIAIAKVIDFVEDTKKIKFELIGLVNDGGYEIGEDGVAVLTDDANVNYDAYKDSKEKEEDYGKWLSLDPVLLDWKENDQKQEEEDKIDYEDMAKFIKGITDKEFSQTPSWKEFKDPEGKPIEIGGYKGAYMNNDVPLRYETNIKNEKGEKIIIHFYACRIKANKEIKSETELYAYFNDPKTHCVLMYINEKTFIIVKDDINSIADGIKKLYEAVSENKAVEQTDIKLETTIINEKPADNTSFTSVPNELKNAVMEIPDIVNYRNGAFMKGENDGKLFNIVGTEGPVDVNGLRGFRKIIVKFDQFPKYEMKLEAENNRVFVSFKCDNWFAKVPLKQYSGKAIIEYLESCAKAVNKLKAREEARSNQIVAKTKDQSNQNKTGKESIDVNYDVKSVVSESVCESTITVNRNFSKPMRKWYVLSEAVYDDGTNKSSKLDEASFVESMNKKSDFTKFAKSSKLAKFMAYESHQNYNLTSDKGYVPSIATPLYESVVIVKFNNMDQVTDKMYLGKHKIG